LYIRNCNFKLTGVKGFFTEIIPWQFSQYYACAYAKLKVVIVAIYTNARLTWGYQMADVKAISSYFIARSSELNENDLTNLKLQKLLFYTQADRLKKHGQMMFDEPIEAWSYGPVVSSVYHWLKGCGAYPITTFDIETDDSKLTAAEKVYLGILWDNYSKYSAIFLVKKTHEIGSPWEKAFQEGKSSIEIPIESIKQTSLANEWK
jgi:uncharacterized phage-associated protein